MSGKYGDRRLRRRHRRLRRRRFLVGAKQDCGHLLPLRLRQLRDLAGREALQEHTSLQRFRFDEQLGDDGLRHLELMALVRADECTA